VEENFVLSVIQPPEGEAKYGKVTVSEPLPKGKLFTLAYWAIRERDGWMHPEVANWFAAQVMSRGVGRELVETGTGLHFRIDRADNAPYICASCGRLVPPEEAEETRTHSRGGERNELCPGCRQALGG
jgi:DNA-directed RNA polymerase subunit RPC12/RpoP